ncbi:hypothetical protein AGMMS49975_16830 [Clostridia bacterium]|nr:hypothetical protein AGMMS49975_16830 [Clostridia bacterium]
MLHLVEHNAEIGQKFQRAVKDEWERKNSQLIEEFSKKEERLSDLCAECDEMEKLKTEIANEYESKVHLSENITEQVRGKIADAKGDLASFFAEYFLFCGESSTEINDASSVFFGSSIDENPEEHTDIKYIFEVLKENLKSAGVADKRLCSALSAYMLSAYIIHVPLIFAGFGANAIIDALSATIFNKTADKIVVKDNMFDNKALKPEIIAVHNGFGCMNLILNIAKSSYICFVAQTSEELSIEPRSMCNYALPVFTEYFLSSNETDDFYGTLSSIKYNEKRKGRAPIFPAYVLPVLAFQNCKMLLGITSDIHKEISEYEMLLLQTLPVMISLNKREELVELLSAVNLSDKDKIEIYKLMGEKQ